jgi:hypothetical protein
MLQTHFVRTRGPAPGNKARVYMPHVCGFVVRADRGGGAAAATRRTGVVRGTRAADVSVHRIAPIEGWRGGLMCAGARRIWVLEADEMAEAV